MSEILTSDERFVEAPALYINNDYIGEVGRDKAGVYVDGLYLSVPQARELRDWLINVIPTPECPTCRTVLAFEGDVCGLCNPETTEGKTVLTGEEK